MINLNSEEYQPKSDITKEQLLEKYSDYDIYKQYIGDFDVGEVFRSPLRRDDDRPSFNIFYSKRYDRLLFKDFAGKRGDCIKFVQLLLSLSTYRDAIDRINSDMSHSTSVRITTSEVVKKSKASMRMSIVVREWEDRDLEYWRQYHISPPTLKHYNVVPIQGFYTYNVYKETKDIAYAYLEYKDDTLTYKVYRPTVSKNDKWRSNTPYGVHQGYTQLPHNGDILIITKSLKDVMSIYENTIIPSIAVQSETCFIKDTVIDEYKFRFDKVATLFDNDKQGKEQAESYEKMYDIPAIFIPDKFGVKDFTDLVKTIGIHNATEELNNLLIT
jgi:chorismate mutase